MMTPFVIKLVTEVYGLFRKVSFSEEMTEGSDWSDSKFKLMHSTGKL